MKKSLWFLAPILLISPLYSQGYGPRASLAQRPYDPAREVTVSGMVTSVLHPSMGRRMTGTHVILKTENEVVEVHLGPTFFLDSHKFSVSQGDTLTLTGSRLSDGGKSYIIVREVAKGSQSLTLRARNGIPSWNRQGAGRW